MSTARIFSLAIAIVTVAVPATAGITYQLRTVTAKGVTMMFTVYAAGTSYRTSMEPSEQAPEINRQYPIVISNDGGKTERAIRPANRTWYERSNERAKSITAIGENARVLQPSVTLVEEASNERIEGLETRKFVLKISYIVESEIQSERVALHATRTVLLWTADVQCAPKSVRQLYRVRLNAPELDQAVELKMNSLDGLIMRVLDSQTERYEGGALRALQSTLDVIRPRCIEVEPSFFAIPPGYTYQEPVIAGPGQ